MNPKARNLARGYALQALYQWQIADASPHEIEAQFIKHHKMNKKTDFEYFKELVHNIPKVRDEMDKIITPYLKRDLSELDPIELAILRLSTYELAKRPDIPYRVVINEALELTKKFGSVEGYKFVNGVLDHVAHHIRQSEITLERKK